MKFLSRIEISFTMKTTTFALLGLLGSLVNLPAQTPAFNCGSNGSYGAIDLTAGDAWLQLPPDGIFNCTTIVIPIGRTLRFLKNALNTPVYLLATGDVTITGTIDIDGKSPIGISGGLAGPGAFDGGQGSTDIAGAGGGPGGGTRATLSPTAHAVSGSFRTLAARAQSGATYGNSLVLPLVGGSGGGGAQNSGNSYGGGGGGGAILIASNTKIMFVYGGGSTNLSARGGGGINASETFSGSGSGGAVRLVAPLVTGNCNVNVGGGNSGAGTGGVGRFRIDAYDTTGLNFSPSVPDATGSVMVVFPTPLPKLSVSNAAGTAIAENATGPVSVILSAGTNPSQTIQVRARDFGSVVPIRVRLVPESGDATTFESTIDNTVNNPATADVPVTMPINTGVRVEVFTR